MRLRPCHHTRPCCSVHLAPKTETITFVFKGSWVSTTSSRSAVRTLLSVWGLSTGVRQAQSRRHWGARPPRTAIDPWCSLTLSTWVQAHTPAHVTASVLHKPALRQGDRQPRAQPATKAAMAIARRKQARFDWGRSLGVPGLLTLVNKYAKTRAPAPVLFLSSLDPVRDQALNAARCPQGLSAAAGCWASSLHWQHGRDRSRIEPRSSGRFLVTERGGENATFITFPTTITVGLVKMDFKANIFSSIPRNPWSTIPWTMFKTGNVPCLHDTMNCPLRRGRH